MPLFYRRNSASTIGVNRYLVVLQLILLIFGEAIHTNGADNSSSLDKNLSQLKPSNTLNTNDLYTCEWSYLQLQDLFVAFTINRLSLIDRNNRTDVQVANNSFTDGYGSIEANSFVLAEISANVTSEQMKSERLDPKLPFIFFINGFNTLNEYGEVNGTWMYNVAKTLAGRGLQNRANKVEPETRANIIFLTWGIPHIYAETPLAIIPSYFKTIAHYDVILDFVSETIVKMIEFVEDSRSLDGGWKSEKERDEFYRQFQFFGHSLGSHIMSDAVDRVRGAYNNQLKFGRLTNMDPAMPCFISLGREIPKGELTTDPTVEVVVLHSNAGFAGLTVERANLEIVLNGGTFQPACHWFDLSCHHSRSTDILGYLDDRCQMVAYKCTSYIHFKNGACETCEFGPNSTRSPSTKQSDTYAKNCVLVNMPEQHKDTKEVIEFVSKMDDQQIRQLAHDDEDNLSRLMSKIKRFVIEHFWSPSPLSEASNSLIGLDTRLGQNSRPPHQHFVNTNPNFRSGRKTHCLQHYQARMMILPNSTNTKQSDKCPISSYLNNRANEINLKLIHDSSLLSQQAGGIGWKLNWMKSSAYDTQDGQASDERKLKYSPNIKLAKIIDNSLYTSLVNFEGSPELFIGARIDNIDLEGLRNCLRKQNISSLNLVLDIPFMSHTDRKFRHAFSSVLCGEVAPNGSSISKREGEEQGGLLLRLCKQSELSSVSGNIDKFLQKIKSYELSDSWRVSLLNSLFSIFAEWQPF